MTVACTRCGASQEGEILNPPITFTFKHERGCGNGVGPLVIVKGKTPKKVEATLKEIADTTVNPKKEFSFKTKKSKKLKKGQVPWEKAIDSKDNV